MNHKIEANKKIIFTVIEKKCYLNVSFSFWKRTITKHLTTTDCAQTPIR